MLKKLMAGTLATGLLFSVGGNVLAADYIKSDISSATIAEVPGLKDTYKLPIDMKKVTKLSKYGEKRGNDTHQGIDFTAPEGTAITAAEGGKVVVSMFGEKGSGFGGYGNVVVLEHEHEYYDAKNKKNVKTKLYTLYGHMKNLKEPALKIGQTVKAGDKIGVVGSTGNSTGPHLHFEVKTEKTFGQVDPNYYLPDYKIIKK